MAGSKKLVQRQTQTDCFTLGVILGSQWYIGHRGATTEEQATARDEIANDLLISDVAAFIEGWSESVRLLEQQPWLPCELCHREYPRMLLHLMLMKEINFYLCLPCFQEQEKIEWQIIEHEARHS
jgi:hypothetical protein